MRTLSPLYFSGMPPVVAKAIPNPVGIHTHGLSLEGKNPLHTNADFEAMKQAGIRFVRTDLLWGAIEKDGKYDFQKYDNFLQSLKQHDLQPMMILGLGHPQYSQGHLTIYPSETRQAFENYAKAAVEHFKGQGVIWELVQQPNMEFFWHPQPSPKDYTAMAKQLLPQLRKLDPSATFVAPSLAGHGLAFQEACYKEGLLNDGLVDAISVHPYRKWPQNPESIIDNYKKTQDLIKEYNHSGKEIPIMLGEWGYHRLDGDPKTQASLAVRQFLVGHLLGSPVNVWHDWKGDIFGVTDDPKNFEQQFGLVNRKLEKHPAFFAIEHMQTALQGQVYKKRLPSKPDDYVLLFEGTGKKTIVAWTTGLSHPASITVTPFVELRDVPLSAKPIFMALDKNRRLESRSRLLNPPTEKAKL